MTVKVVISFSGAVCGTCGETLNIEDNVLLQDLLQAGYVVSLEAPPAPEEPPAEEPAPKKRRKRS